MLPLPRWLLPRQRSTMAQDHGVLGTHSRHFQQYLRLLECIRLCQQEIWWLWTFFNYDTDLISTSGDLEAISYATWSETFFATCLLFVMWLIYWLVCLCKSLLQVGLNVCFRCGTVWQFTCLASFSVRECSWNAGFMAQSGSSRAPLSFSPSNASSDGEQADVTARP